MLEKKLGNARQRNVRLIAKTIICFFVIILSCIFIIENIPYFKSTKLNDSLVKKTRIKELTNLDIEEAREEFKDLLQEYNDGLKPHLQAVNLKNWNPEAFSEINEINEHMMLSFGNSDYFNAINSIKLLTTKALVILQESKKYFEDNIEKANLYFSDDKYDEAELHIKRALIVSPESKEAHSLKKDIERLQKILPYLGKAKVARTENNLLKELKFLERVLKIYPNRSVESERVKLLKKMIRNNDFDNHIATGLSQIKNHKLNDARYHYQSAKKIYPDRVELEVLLKKLLSEEKLYRIEHALKQAEQEIRDDNWEQAKSSFVQVMKDMPDNEMAIAGIKRANEIIETKLIFNQYLKHPNRLSDSNVLRMAKKIIEQAEPSSKYSAEIKKKIGRLNNLIKLFNRLIPVMVVSDNMTSVQVHGIGKLGSIKQKIIYLKPGAYTFEGERNGFKSKLLKILIPYDQNNYSVSIVCDESI